MIISCDGNRCEGVDGGLDDKQLIFMIFISWSRFIGVVSKL